jgi:hypothetical protein
MHELITAREAAGILRKSPRTVARWVDAGKLDVAKKLPGDTGARLFDRAAVEAIKAELDAEFDARHGYSTEGVA